MSMYRVSDVSELLISDGLLCRQNLSLVSTQVPVNSAVHLKHKLTYWHLLRLIML